jgi:hypothetical protein
MHRYDHIIRAAGRRRYETMVSAILWYQSARPSRCTISPGPTHVRGGRRGKPPTYGRCAGVADAPVLNQGGEMDTRVVAGAGHAGATIGCRPIPKSNGRSRIEWCILRSRRPSRKDCNGARTQPRRRCPSRSRPRRCRDPRCRRAMGGIHHEDGRGTHLPCRLPARRSTSCLCFLSQP